MGHSHSVRDTGAHFTIDQFTRVIKNDSAQKTTIVQYDHNSERLTFEMPLYIDGHAMTLCDLIEIHYINIATDGKSQNPGVYEVDDIKAEGEKAIFTWLISQEATQLAGSLSFFIVFKCTEDGVTVYRWGTEICKTLAISDGMDNGEAVLTEYPDIIAQWKAQIFGASDDAVAAVETAKISALAAIDSAGEAKKTAVLDSIPDEYEALSALAESNYRNKAGAIVVNAEGESIVLNDASEYPLQSMSVYGKSTQDGTPTPDAPVDIVSVERPTVTVDEQTLSLAYTLPGIPVSSGGNYTDANGQQWICDEVDLARGVYVQRIKAEQYSGNAYESWALFTADGVNQIYRQADDIYHSANEPLVLCDYYRPIVISDRVANYNAIYTASVNICINTQEVNSVSEWYDILKNRPIRVLYVLATPIETALSDAEITAFKALCTNKPNTTILNDAGAYMSVEYVADTKTYIDNKIAEMIEEVTE